MLSGLIGAGAQEGLEELLVRQLKEQMAQEEIRQAKAREAQNARRLDLDERRQAFGERVRQEDIEQSTMDSLRANNDRMDARLTRLNTESANEQAERDRKAALDALLPMLPPNVRQAIEAQNAGVTGIKPDDLKSPEQRKADDDAAVERAGRIAGAQAAAAAKFRPPPAPRQPPQMTPGQQFQAIQSLRRSFTGETEAAREVGMQLAQMKAGIDAAKRGDMAAGSQAILVTFQKILDPASVVRESEYARSSSGQSLMSRMQGAMQQLAQGGAGVPVAELEKFVKLAETFASNQMRAAGESKTQIEAIAKEFGIDPSLITRDIGVAAPDEWVDDEWVDVPPSPVNNKR